MNRTTMDDEERRRRLLQRQRRAGIAPQGQPGVEGQPSRPAPASGIAPVPKYGSISYRHADGSTRVIDAEGDRNIRSVAGIGPQAIPSRTPMRITPNHEKNVTADTTAVSLLTPGVGEELRVNPATGAEVVMAQADWKRRDANRAARLGRVAPDGRRDAPAPDAPAPEVAPESDARGARREADPAGGVAPTERAAAAGGIAPSMRSDAWNRIQARRERDMERESYGRRPGATSANLRQWDREERERVAREQSEANAERSAGLVRSRQDVDREKNRQDATTRVKVAETKADADVNVAELDAGARKYGDDKRMETELAKADREAQSAARERLREMEFKREEWKRKHGGDASQMSNSDINSILDKDDATSVRMYREALLASYSSAEERIEVLNRLAVERYGEDADWTYLERLEKGIGQYVDIQDRRAGVHPGGGNRSRVPDDKRKAFERYRVTK